MRTSFRLFVAIGCALWGLAAAPGVEAYSSGAGTCSYPSAGWSQMGGGQAGTGGFVIQVRDESGQVTHYFPGKTYTVEISNPGPYAGFLLQCVKGMPGSPNVGGAGTFAWSDSTLYQNGPCTTRQSSVTHQFARSWPPMGRRTADQFTWTAPAAMTGPVTFHMVGVVTQYAWYGRVPMITLSLLEGSTPVSSLSWAQIKSLFR